MSISRTPLACALLALAIASGIFSIQLLSAFQTTVSPKITLSSSAVLPNQAITVTGEGFTASAANPSCQAA